MSEGSVAIIGAGVAGLACARALFAAQLPVAVIEKSRGLGGRVATRRAGRLAFDHGAQYVVARSDTFKEYLALATATGYAASWQPARQGATRGEGWLVGSPGMSSLVKPLATGLDVRRGVRVVATARRGDEWWVNTESGDALGPFATLLLAVPAPQAVQLTTDLVEGIDIASQLSGVRMAPCWTVLVTFPERLSAPADFIAPVEGALTSIVRDSAKPGRNASHDSWVLQATPDWTRAHLEETPTQVAEQLREELAAVVGPLPQVAYLTAHLWRYARVERPLGKECLWDSSIRLGLCGDWCLDARVEAAWQSGSALAARVLASR